MKVEDKKSILSGMQIFTKRSLVYNFRITISRVTLIVLHNTILYLQKIRLFQNAKEDLPCLFMKHRTYLLLGDANSACGSQPHYQKNVQRRRMITDINGPFIRKFSTLNPYRISKDPHLPSIFQSINHLPQNPSNPLTK